MNRTWKYARIVCLMAFVLILSPLGFTVEEDGINTNDNVDVHVEKMAKTLMKHAENLAKSMKHNEKYLQKNLEALQENLQAAQEQLETLLPQTEEQLHHSMKMLAQAQITIPEINIPEIKVPEIHIPEIKIQHVPPPPNIGQVGENFKGERVSETLEKTFEVQPTTPLKVDSIFSTIQIEPGKNPSAIEVTVKKEGGADTKEKAQQILDQIEVNIEQTKDAVEVKVQLKKDKKESFQSNNTLMHSEIKILVPSNTPIEVRNSFGDVTIQQSQGEINSENKFGKTHIEDSKGNLHVSSDYGQLTVERHNGDGWVRGQFGDVFVDGLTGDLEVEVNYGKTTIETDNPNVCIDGKFSFGSVFITLPEEYSGKIEASSSFGEISAPEGLTKKKKMFDESVEGEIGSGKGQIQINSSYSPVKITCNH